MRQITDDHLRRGTEIHEKADPYGFAAEVPPHTASIIADLDAYDWNDSGWMHRRRENPVALDKPISIYEVHLGSWKKDYNRHHGWKSYRRISLTT